MRALFQKKWIKIPYLILLYSFAIYGFFLVGTYVAMKFKLTNDAGLVDVNTRYYQQIHDKYNRKFQTFRTMNRHDGNCIHSLRNNQRCFFLFLLPPRPAPPGRTAACSSVCLCVLIWLWVFDVGPGCERRLAEKGRPLSYFAFKKPPLYLRSALRFIFFS